MIYELAKLFSKLVEISQQPCEFHEFRLMEKPVIGNEGDIFKKMKISASLPMYEKNT